jgi:hypothetical protein
MERSRHKSFVTSFPPEDESELSSQPTSAANTPTRNEFIIGDTKEKRLSDATSRGNTPPSSLHPPLPPLPASTAPAESQSTNRMSSPPLSLSPPPSRQGQVLQTLHRATLSHPPNLQVQQANGNLQQPSHRLFFYEDNDSVKTHSRQNSTGSAL